MATLIEAAQSIITENSASKADVSSLRKQAQWHSNMNLDHNAARDDLKKAAGSIKKLDPELHQHLLNHAAKHDKESARHYKMLGMLNKVISKHGGQEVI